MSLSVSRSTQPLRFDVGIGSADYAEVLDSPVAGGPGKSLLPGSTTVSLAVDELFPRNRSVGGEIMEALVESNSATLRTPSGFSHAARRMVNYLRSRNTMASDSAAIEIENLLADADLLERCRMALLET